MDSEPKKIIINIKDNKYLHWKLCLKNKLKDIKSNNLEKFQQKICFTKFLS